MHSCDAWVLAPAIVLYLLTTILSTPAVVAIVTPPAATPVLTPATATVSPLLPAALSAVTAHAAFDSFSVPHCFDAICWCGRAVGLRTAELGVLVRDFPLPCCVVIRS